MKFMIYAAVLAVPTVAWAACDQVAGGRCQEKLSGLLAICRAGQAAQYDQCAARALDIYRDCRQDAGCLGTQ